jgi:AcrR family transcriptional regulator
VDAVTDGHVRLRVGRDPVGAATVKRKRAPATPLARMLREPTAARRATALDAFELARRKWLVGERLDIGKLAEELGVGRATVFRWVGTREQLYGEVISAAFGQTIEWARRTSTGRGATLLTKITHHLLSALSASRPLRTFVSQDPEFALRIVMSSSSPVEGRVVATVRGLIETEVTAGHLRPTIDVESLAYVIVRIAESFLYRDVLTGDRPDIETATKAIGLLFAGQAGPAKPARKR